MKQDKEKIGVVGLTAFVLSAMVGGGFYDLPQNMASVAGVVGQILGWILTGFIIWFIVRSFMTLSEVRPEYTTGLYHYAEAGFGKFTAFFVSWGYWICESFAVSAYSVLLMSTLDAFWPGTFSGGNNLNSIIGGSVILWVMIFLLMRGIRVTSHVDVFGTICMLAITTTFILTMVVAFNWDTFTTNIFANQNMPAIQDKALGNLASQMKNTTMITLWVFAGIEGAVMLSGKAKRTKDVQRATKYGFLICLCIYALASLLPLGVRSYGQLAGLSSPSTAALMEIVLGPIGRLIITAGIIIAVSSSWLTWVLVLSEMPRAAAQDGTFPKIFAKVNKGNVAYVSLFFSALVIEIILFSTSFAERAFNNAVTIVATMTVPPYLISMLYLAKISRKDETFNPNNNPTTITRKKARVISTLAVIGALFIGYAAGIKYLTIAFAIYAVGIPVFMYARKQYQPDQPIFTKNEKIFAVIIVLLAVVGLFLLFT
ncbi:amino acid permease [Lactobacillus sp. S2-2]|uniref:amino acid permease n=1 Tax=Lactobacillus sp. S2-2 TaxID=2692917 RepID=UPI001F02F088|nr:amino acid permease [Lactobacillus sp. S2-2]MCF6514613.1 amino acid permease [Lactobacillus sp. S2-2]